VLLFWLATASVLVAGALTCLGLGPRRRCDAATGSLALAILLAVTLAKILLLAGLFRPVPVAVSAAACLAAAVAWLVLDHAARGRAAATAALWAERPSVRGAPLAWACAAALAVTFSYFGYLATHLPPIAWDALYYHLISVSQWVRTGHLVSPVPGMSSQSTDVQILTQADSFPHDTELIAAWFAVFTHSVRLVQLAQLVFVPMLFSGVYGLSRHLGARARWAILGGTVAVLAPVVLSQVATNYVDVAQASALAAGWQFLVAAFPLRPDAADLRRGSAGRRRRHLLLAGLCLGLAAGVKSQGLLYCGVAVLLVVVLSARQTRAVLKGDQPRWDVPSPARACAALAVPMIAVGSFWYVRTWLRWGSPTWPITIGPFSGRTGLTQWDNVGGLAIPVPWRGSGFLVLLARDWAAALPFLRPAGLGDYGTPGLVWLLACVPAIIALLASRTARRRYRYALVVVLLPLTVISVVSPVGWHARLSIPLLIAGGVTLALLLDGGLPGLVAEREARREARRVRRTGTGVRRAGPAARVPPPAGPADELAGDGLLAARESRPGKHAGGPLVPAARPGHDAESTAGVPAVMAQAGGVTTLSAPAGHRAGRRVHQAGRQSRRAGWTGVAVEQVDGVQAEQAARAQETQTVSQAGHRAAPSGHRAGRQGPWAGTRRGRDGTPEPPASAPEPPAGGGRRAAAAGRDGGTGRRASAAERRAGLSGQRAAAGGRRAGAAGRQSGSGRLVTGLAGRAGVSLAGAAVLALALWQAWDQAANPGWNVPSGTDGVRAVLALASSPLQDRMNIGPWQAWNSAQAQMTGPGSIGFFTQDPPDFTLPYAGQDFSRAVVNIGPYPWKGHGPQPTDAAIAQLMARANVRYLYLAPGTVAYQVVVPRRSSALRTVATFDPGSPAFGGTILERSSTAVASPGSGQPSGPGHRAGAGRRHHRHGRGSSRLRR
jgi:hypothetical protein